MNKEKEKISSFVTLLLNLMIIIGIIVFMIMAIVLLTKSCSMLDIKQVVFNMR